MKNHLSLLVMTIGWIIWSGCSPEKTANSLSADVAGGGDPVVLAACPPLAEANLQSVVCNVLTDGTSAMTLGPYTPPGGGDTSPDAATGLRIIASKEVFPLTTAYVITFWEYTGAGGFALRQNADSLRVHYNSPGVPGAGPNGAFSGQTFNATTAAGNRLTGLGGAGQVVGGIGCENCHNFNRVKRTFRRSMAGGNGPTAADVARRIAAFAAPEGGEPDANEEAQIAGRLQDLRANFSLTWDVAAP